MLTHFKGVLLDIDGTLVDSNDVNACAWMEALQAHGIEINYIKLREAVGMGGDNLLPKLANLDAESEQGKAISETRSEILKTKYLPGLKAFPKVKALLTRLHDDGYKMVAATSAKPDPDIIRAAIEKSGLSAAEVVLLGDTPYDVQAAQKAGIQSIGVRCGGWAAPDLKGAFAVYNDPADLLAHYDESPLGQNQTR